MSDRSVVVMPCFNEANRLDVRRIGLFLREQSRTSLLLVNDGSTDGTRQLLESLCLEWPGRVSLVDLSRNSGKAEAVRQGMLAGLNTSPTYIGYWDADLATPLEAMPAFRDVLRRCQQVELVVGCRLPLLGRQIRRRTARRLSGHVFAFAASAALGVRVRDTQCGAKLFRATPRLAKLFAEPFVSRWIFDVELMMRLREQALEPRKRLSDAVYEFPLDNWQEIDGSKLRLRDYARALGELTAVYRQYRLAPRPVAGRAWTGGAPDTASSSRSQPGSGIDVADAEDQSKRAA